MAGVRIIDRDHGYEKLMVNVRRLARGTRINVGVNENLHPGSRGLTNADLGAIHEFGAPSRGIPARSFLRAWVDSQSWFNRLKNWVYEALFSEAVFADKFGRYAVDGVRERIRQGIPPELQRATAKRKAAKGQPDIPLIADGDLINAIEFEVTK